MSWPATRVVRYLGATYWAYQFHPDPHVVSKQGHCIGLHNPG
jgi:hypothetical protein